MIGFCVCVLMAVFKTSHTFSLVSVGECFKLKYQIP